MSDEILFDRFQSTSTLPGDAFFDYVEATDNEDGDRTVVIARLGKNYLGEQVLIDDLLAYFENLHRIRTRDIQPVLTIVQHSRDGFGVVMERATGANLGDIDEPETLISVVALADGLCDAIHKANVKGLIHGRLRRRDVWVDGERLQVGGFGATVIAMHGHAQGDSELAPELAMGVAPGPAADVYAIARLVADCYPAVADHAAIVKALDPRPEKRFARVRDFQAAFLSDAEASDSAEPGVPAPTSGEETRETLEDEPIRRTSLRPKFTGRSVQVHDVDETKHENPFDSAGGTRPPREESIEPNPLRKPAWGWLYFRQREFIRGGYSPDELLTAINRDLFDERLKPVAESVDALNYVLESPGLYDPWLKRQGGVASLSHAISALENKTRAYRKAEYAALPAARQKSIIALNRRLLEAAYPDLSPVATATWIAGMVKWSAAAALTAVIVGGGFYGTRLTGNHPPLPGNLVRIDAGKYSPTPYLRRYLKAAGAHPVTIEAPFLIQPGEVTVGDFKQYVASLDEQSRLALGDFWKQDLSGVPYADERPVDYISRRDAAAYAAWLSRKTGVDLRLPSYEQWVAAIVSHGENEPVLSAAREAPLESMRSRPDHLIGNLREWSSDECGDDAYRLLGEDYLTSVDNLGELPCLNETLKMKRAGFRLVAADS